VKCNWTPNSHCICNPFHWSNEDDCFITWTFSKLLKCFVKAFRSWEIKKFIPWLLQIRSLRYSVNHLRGSHCLRCSCGTVFIFCHLLIKLLA
jgi:hypothetical protein